MDLTIGYEYKAINALLCFGIFSLISIAFRKLHTTFTDAMFQKIGKTVRASAKFSSGQTPLRE